MTTVATANVTAANGIDIFPYPLKFANDASLSLQETIKYANGTSIINTSSLVYGTTIANSSLITVPGLTIAGQLFSGIGGEGIVNTQFFTANGTWTNPNNALGLAGNEQVFIMMWGGGGGCASGTGQAGGGACVIGTFLISEVGNTATITVGSGGSISGLEGNASIFTPTGTASVMKAFGGGGQPTASGGGGGGGGLSSGSNSTIFTGGSPLGGATTIASLFGGGGGGSPGGSSIFGGGGGGTKGSNGGTSLYGGGGGAAGSGVGGSSVFGGRGADGSHTTPAIPGGGALGPSVAGARGEVRIWVIK